MCMQVRRGEARPEARGRARARRQGGPQADDARRRSDCARQGQGEEDVRQDVRLRGPVQDEKAVKDEGYVQGAGGVDRGARARIDARRSWMVEVIQGRPPRAWAHPTGRMHPQRSLSSACRGACVVKWRSLCGAGRRSPGVQALIGSARPPSRPAGTGGCPCAIGWHPAVQRR